MVDQVTEDIRVKVDVLMAAVAEMRTKSALIDQHVLAQEIIVKEFMVRTDAKMESIEGKMDAGDEKMDVRFGEMMAVLAKWGTIRDTLVWVGGVMGGLVVVIWGVFVWATGHLWGKG